MTAAAVAAPLPPTEKLPLHIKLGNGFGSVAYGVKDNGFATLLMLFYNQVLGLDAKIVGFILLIALLLDAIVDPLVGHWGDKTHSRRGKPSLRRSRIPPCPPEPTRSARAPP